MFTHYLVTYWRGLDRIAVDFSNRDDAVDYAKELVRTEEAGEAELWCRLGYVRNEVIFTEDR